MCSRDCFHCVYKDCVDGSFTPFDYIELVELEKAVGIFQPEDEQHYEEDLFAVIVLEEKRRRFNQRRREKNKQSRTKETEA